MGQGCVRWKIHYWAVMSGLKLLGDGNDEPPYSQVRGIKALSTLRIGDARVPHPRAGDPAAPGHGLASQPTCPHPSCGHSG